MNRKIGWIVGVAALAALIGGAGILYNKYSGEAERESLLTEDASKAAIEESTSEDADTEEAVSESAESSEDAQELVMAPDFTVYDAEGNEVHLSDFIGKPTIVNFWASWCGPCQMEMPDFDEKYKEVGEEVHFVMVNMTDGSQETLETAMEFVENSGYSFPVYYDTDMDAAMTYGVSSIPSTYFIDAEGHAVAMGRGAIDADTLQYGIDMISGE